MKLLFENWRKYTTKILNEDLLIESLEEAENSVLKRATKLFKGWVYAHDKESYDIIEKKVEKNKIQYMAWYERQKAIDSDGLYHPSEKIYSWEIGGYLVLSIIKTFIIPRDITEQQKKVALLWNYKKIVEGKIPGLENLFKDIFLYIRNIGVSGLKFELDINYFNKNSIWFLPTQKFERYNKPNTWSERDSIPRYIMIENYYRFINFIRDGKKDLNAVADYDELYELINEARPLYMEWQEKQQEKQENKDAKEEMLLNNEDWEIKILLNKSAARLFGKRSNLCTAAPGLNYFDTYSKPNDPLIAITNKKSNKRYQFSFGSEDFKYLRPEEKDKKVCFEQTELDKKELEEILDVLFDVIPEQYEVPYEYLQNYKKNKTT